MNGQAKQGQLKVIYFEGSKKQSKLMHNMVKCCDYVLQTGRVKILANGMIIPFWKARL